MGLRRPRYGARTRPLTPRSSWRPTHLGAEQAPFKKTTLVDFRTRLVRAEVHLALLRWTAHILDIDAPGAWVHADARRIFRFVECELARRGLDP